MISLAIFLLVIICYVGYLLYINRNTKPKKHKQDEEEQQSLEMKSVKNYGTLN